MRGVHISKYKGQTYGQLEPLPSEFLYCGLNKYAPAWFYNRVKALGGDKKVREVLGLKPKTTKWTKKSVIAAAKKYKIASKFNMKEPGACAHAKRNGYYNELTRFFKSKERTVKELKTGKIGTINQLSEQFTKIIGEKVNNFTLAANAKRDRLVTDNRSVLKGYHFKYID